MLPAYTNKLCAQTQLHKENAQLQGISGTIQCSTHQRCHLAWLEVACNILQQKKSLFLVEGADDCVIQALCSTAQQQPQQQFRTTAVAGAYQHQHHMLNLSRHQALVQYYTLEL